ncbi:TPA: DUF262 domain-containing protein [Clostridium botulinum]|nr:DUF262 domain-containing protein [Clostridium botulinum]
MIKSNIEKHNIGWLNKQFKKGRLDFDISIQRKEVWDLEHKSNLIASILLNIPIESLLFEENEDNGYNVLDGKQRSLTFIRFLNSEFRISEKVKVSNINGFDIVGKTFEELPEDLQDDFLEYELSISTLRTLEEKDRGLIFFMRNQAVALSKVELTRVLAGSKLLTQIEELCKAPFISEKIGLTELSKRKFTDQQLVLNILCVENGLKYDLSGQGLMDFTKELSESEMGLSEESYEKISNVLTYLDKSFEKKIRFFKKVNIPIIYHLGKYAMNKGIDTNKFSEIVKNMTHTIQESDNEYADLCTHSTNKKYNIQRRIDLVVQYFEELNK